MITVKEFKNMLNECPNDWTITLKKWEDGNPEDFMKRNHYPMPNRVSVSIQDIQYRKTDDGDVIYKIIMEDDFDNDFTMSPNDMKKIFCGNKNDNDLLDFVLYTEDTPGHYNHVSLNVEEGDRGYSDKNMNIEFEEDI